MTVQRTSWGYIRNTNISGYLSIEELLNQLVSTVRYVCVCVHACDVCTNALQKNVKECHFMCINTYRSYFSVLVAIC